MKRYALLLMVAASLLAGLPSCEPVQVPTRPSTEKPDGSGKDDSGKDDSGKDQPDTPGNPETPDTPVEPEGTVIYYDSLDKSPSSGAWFDQGAAFRSPEGTGVENLGYKSAYAKIVNSWSSSGYPGASGVNGIYYTQNTSFIQVRNISLPDDARVYRLSVGLHNPEGGNTVVPGQTFSIGIADEEALMTSFVELEFDVKQYGKWSYATAVFEIESSATKHISIQIRSLVAQTRSDDLKLMTTAEVPSQGFSFIHSDPVPPVSTKDYAERPMTLRQNSDYKYVDHHATTYRTRKSVRNYEACYDIRRHNPVWVAFPCHAIWSEGGKTRPARDPWRPDPAFGEGEQSVIYASDWDNWPNNTYRYWGGVSDGKFTTRGHLLGSADRGCGNKNALLELNTQTFYPTNIAPELYLNDNNSGDYDATHWGIVERLRQDRWVCSDTLYIVAGCAYEHDDWIVYDDVSGNSKSATSKKCVMPTARYLVALRTKSGSTGKPVWKCSADELMAIGFWFPQRFNRNTVDVLPPLSEYMHSVSEIEKMAGSEFSFFPLAPSGVKDSYDVSDWPGLADIAR